MNLETYPREVHKYRYPVFNRFEVEQYLENNYRFNDCYITLYSFPKLKDYAHANVDCCYFDLDGDEKKRSTEVAFENIKALVKEYEKYKHQNVLSGRGFHFFINTKSISQGTIMQFLSNARDKLNLTLDGRFGNLSQLVRLPGSYNFKAKRWCISLTDEEVLNMSLNEILNLAKERRIGYIENKGETIIIEDSVSYNDDKVFDTEIDGLTIDESALYVPPCVINTLEKIRAPHSERWGMVLLLRDLWKAAYSELSKRDLAELIFKLIKEECKWSDFKDGKTKYFIKYELSRYSFGPSCDYFKKRGLCSSKCLLGIVNGDIRECQ